MSLISDNIVIQFITSDPVLDLVKPAVIVIIILLMLYEQAKPRIERSDKVQL